MSLHALSGAAIALGVTGIGSAIGIALVVKAAGKAMLKRPQKFGMALVFAVLAESPVIYGLLVSILILTNMSKIVTAALGTMALISGITMAATGFLTALGIALVGVASISALAEKEGMFGKTLVFAVLPETIAIYGLLVSLLILYGGGFFLEVPPTLTQNMITNTIYAAGVMCVTGVIAGYYLSRLGVNAVTSIMSREETFGKQLILVILVESIAIYGLLLSILILFYGGLLG